MKTEEQIKAFKKEYMELCKKHDLIFAANFMNQDYQLYDYGEYIIAWNNILRSVKYAKN